MGGDPMESSPVLRTWIAGGERALEGDTRAPESGEHQALHRSFRAEACELLQTMLRATLQLEEGDVSEQPVKAALHASHTLTGAAAVVGLPTIRARASTIQEVLRPYRCADASVPADVTARVTQLIKAMQEELGGARQGAALDPPAPSANEPGGVTPIVKPR